MGMAGIHRPGKSPPPLAGPRADIAVSAGLATSPRGPGLVLGCGVGRIAGEVAFRGAAVLGVDPSAIMLQFAEERRSSEPREASDRLRLMCADLRTLRLAERFSLVIAPENAAGLMVSLADLEALFLTSAHHLLKEGSF